MSSRVSSKEQECASRVMGDICLILCSTINHSVCTVYWNKNISSFWINGAFYYKIKSCAFVGTSHIWGKCKLQTLPQSGKPHCQPHEHPIHDCSTVTRIQKKQNYRVQILLSRLTNVCKMKTGFCIPWICVFLDSTCVFYRSCQSFL
jgi:hypothetical protein